MSNEGTVSLVNQRFHDGIAVANGAFQQSTNINAAIKSFADQLIASTPGLPVLDLVPMPTYEQLDAMFNLTAPIAPAIPDFPALPDIQDAPVTDFSYTESPYASEVGSALHAKVVAGIANGGTGLGAAAEEALWNREQERALLERQDSVDRLSGDLAGTGFSMPDGVVAAMLLEQETKFVDARLTSNRDITMKQADLTYQQTTKILDVAVQTEGNSLTYATSMRNRLLEAAKAGPQIAVDLFRAGVERVNVYIAQYNAIATKANALSDIFKSQAQLYAVNADVKTKIIGASVQKFSAEVDGAAKDNQSRIQEGTLLLERIKNYLTLELEAMKAVGQINAQIAASALTGMSASASMGASDSFQNSTQTSSSTSAGMNTTYYHYYDHTE